MRILIEELVKVKLLVVLFEEFSKEVTVVEILLKVSDTFGELDLFIEPVQYYLAHCICYYLLFMLDSNLYNLLVRMVWFDFI